MQITVSIKLEVSLCNVLFNNVRAFNLPQNIADLLPSIYYTLNKLNIETGAFAQLTRKYMSETFNPNTPDIDDVR